MNYQEQADQIESACKRWAEWYSDQPEIDWPDGTKPSESKHLTLGDVEPGTLEELGRRVKQEIKWSSRGLNKVGAVLILSFGKVLFAIHARERKGTVETTVVLEGES